MERKPINPKYLGENGIHRVPLWRIGGFALNNTATNLYMFFMNYVSYYLMGWVGVAMVTASSFAMMMRLWDGVTDPFVGFMVDKMDGKFGKNRPFMVIGNVILAVTSYIMFHVTHLLPENPTLRFGFFIVLGAIYYLGYTCQCVVTKSAQSCLTNDPKQRPLFASFDGVYNTILFAGIAVVAANIAAANLANDPTNQSGYGSLQWFDTMWMFTAIVSGIFTTIAVISISPKDRTEFFGTGKAVKVGLKDYWDTLKGNRAIQMLVVSASSDKLASTAKTSAVSVAMFACLAGWLHQAAGQHHRYDHHPLLHRDLRLHLLLCHPSGPEKGHAAGFLRRYHHECSDDRPVVVRRSHHHDLQPRGWYRGILLLHHRLSGHDRHPGWLPGHLRQHRHPHDRRLRRL